MERKGATQKMCKEKKKKIYKDEGGWQRLGDTNKKRKAKKKGIGK